MYFLLMKAYKGIYFIVVLSSIPLLNVPLNIVWAVITRHATKITTKVTKGVI